MSKSIDLTLWLNQGYTLYFVPKFWLYLMAKSNGSTKLNLMPNIMPKDSG
jgi:hypothetical protein